MKSPSFTYIHKYIFFVNTQIFQINCFNQPNTQHQFLFVFIFILLSLWNHFFMRTVKCTNNDDCPLTEACIGDMCQRPCDVNNPCAFNAICVNTNHGSDCSCTDGYQGNGYVGCQPGNFESADVAPPTRSIY